MQKRLFLCGRKLTPKLVSVKVKLALNASILSKFSIFDWIYLLFILVILVGVELPLCIVVILS